MKINMQRKCSRSCSDIRTIGVLRSPDIPACKVARIKSPTEKDTDLIATDANETDLDVGIQTEEIQFNAVRSCCHGDHNEQTVLIIEQGVRFYGARGTDSVPFIVDGSGLTSKHREDQTNCEEIDSVCDQDSLNITPHTVLPRTASDIIADIEEAVPRHAWNILPREVLDGPARTIQPLNTDDQLVDIEISPHNIEQTPTRASASSNGRWLNIALLLAIFLVCLLCGCVLLYLIHQMSSAQKLSATSVYPSLAATSVYPSLTAAATTVTLTITEPPIYKTEISAKKNETKTEESFKKITVMEGNIQKVFYNDTHTLVYFNSTGKYVYFKNPQT